ncbi:signal peptidase I [Aquibacillus koreensis]|uniref:Signal peptidase I n=1 Tax=Aquibacillus koreensis TaxID=279446 RepID=A0A9X3WNB8_9BACI|nr:signal peptidase I [Aquibacillus koreensis]MCT2534503.1 signal peptidase I [Aquibacillus koreensis]MDC3421903.1 signal peptidase I [Aquibacillus koreensis]
MTQKKNEWFDWIKALVVAGLLAFVIRMFVFAPIIVEGPSMLPTLEDEDHMIVNKFSYLLGDPDRFDIVVFHATSEKDYIKRVIGLPGETVEVKDDTLFINGEKVEEKFLEEKKKELANNQVYTFDFTLEDIPGASLTIPDDHILVLGDNRTNSTDSRLLGLISYDQLVGKTSFIYWPLDRIGIIKE